MENEPLTIQDELRARKGRIMGKLFKNRDRKSTLDEKPTDNGDINDFLRGPSDRLQVNHPAPRPPPLSPPGASLQPPAAAGAAPPALAKLDTLSAARYPNATPVRNLSQQSLPLRPPTQSPRLPTSRPASSRRNKKALVVRFVDTFPDIIGEGGDECEHPVTEVARRKATRPPPPALPPPPRRPTDLTDQARAYSEFQPSSEPPFNPGPLRRTQTGFSSINSPPLPPEREVRAGQQQPAPFLDSGVISTDEKRKSFIELQQAQMREAEGRAFAQAVRSASDGCPTKGAGNPMQLPSSHRDDDAMPTTPVPAIHESPVDDKSYQLQETPDRYPRHANLEHSPSSLYSTASGAAQPYAGLRQNSGLTYATDNGSPSSPQKTSMNLHDVVMAAGEDALQLFAQRTRHLWELFRLHSETKRPLLSCGPDELARAAIWWFLQGRMALEVVIRDRPNNSEEQRMQEMTRQQAYADLAKAYWLVEEVLPEILGSRRSPVDGEAGETRVAIVSSLRKLAISMKRNGFLPEEEAFLPQSIDKSIWVDYPAISQDITALLWGLWGSALSAAQRPTPTMTPLESLPLGDTPQEFSFGRVRADVYLMEQGMESQQFYFPCLLSMVRPQTQTGLAFVLTSQNGAVRMRIQGHKPGGPNWDGLKWQSDINAIDMKLPRGFVLVIQLAQQDYRLLWNMYDFGAKVQSILFPRKDEQPVFRSTLKAFQYFDSDPQGRQFPKESVPGCEVALFERVIRESAATGPRAYHRGFRVAVVTGTRTRTLSSVNHAYVPQMPVLFGFLRGDQDDPALLLKFDSGRSKGTMVMSFSNDAERLQLHNLLVGTALANDEQVVAELPLSSLTISQRLADPDGMAAVKKLPYQRVRIVNVEDGNDQPPTVLAERLRLVVEFQHGTITDRVNVAPGELRIRLQVADTMSLTVLRQPQQDMTVAVSEAQVAREMGKELSDALHGIQSSTTCRTYRFNSLQDLHSFQAALTGFKVLFDGTAAAFAIARRRMVVPIHKKWEAGATRIQVVQQDKVLQLLAFFPGFHHGQCMGFVLKGTDVFEAFSRGSKAGVKIDDAKFPLPRVVEPGNGGGNGSATTTDEMGFVCLDYPDLPGEHDDISIMFDSEAERDKFAACLPAPVRSSRLSRR